MRKDIDKYIAKDSSYEFPSSLVPEFRKAKKMEWITVIYLITASIFMFLAMGSSQAMKAAWIEDIVSLFPSIAFLVASRFYNKEPDATFPYGYHKAFTVAFVAGSIALLALGLFIFTDSVISLVKLDHPTIGTIELFGREFWMGWIMIAALLYSFGPSLVLGIKKLPIAKQLHIKVLHVDSEAQKADWMTALAGITGIIGIGFGLWWADSVAAIFISFSIVRDGVKRSWDGMKDLMEELPATYDNKEIHPLVGELVNLCLNQGWVKDVRVRLREHGMVFFGEIFVIPHSEDNLIDKIQDLFVRSKSLSWEIEDLAIHPVHSFPNPNSTYENIPDKEKERLHKESKDEAD